MYSSVLHLTDLDATHFHRCEQAAAIAACFNAPLYLLHVIEQPPSLQLAQGLGFAEIERPNDLDAQTVLQTLSEALNIPRAHMLVKIGSLREQALETILALNCDLLIIGQHTHHFIPTLLENSAPCDVLTLR